MTEDKIKEINAKCPYEQGIFVQPWGVPVSIKEPVIYSRYNTGGMSGGNCWGDEATHYEEEKPKEHMQVLDIVLKELKPDISYLDYKKIERLIHDNYETEHEYYGNSADYCVNYIILSKLEELLKNL